MSVIIKLLPELRDALLSQIPPGVNSYQALMNADLILNRINGSPLEYSVECDEDVARTLLVFAETHCREAVREIEFALRLVRAKETQPHRRGRFW